MDALDLLRTQHRDVEDAFQEFESLGPEDAERRTEIARTVITDLSVHAGIEEVAFYPTVREALPELDDAIEEDLEEHREAKELLSEVQGMDPTDPAFESTFRQITADVRHHVEEEENDLFPRVREAFTEEELDDLGEAMEQLTSQVPTNPHPHAPQEPPANVLAGPVAGILDRIRDAIRERVGKDTV